MGRTRLDHLERCLDTIRTEAVAGDLVECGTGRGGGAIFMRAYLEAHELPRPAGVGRRPVPVVARARPDADACRRNGVAGFQADLNLVRDGFERFDLLDDRVRFLRARWTPRCRMRRSSSSRCCASATASGGEVRTVLDHLYDGWRPAGS